MTPCTALEKPHPLHQERGPKSQIGDSGLGIQIELALGEKWIQGLETILP